MYANLVFMIPLNDHVKTCSPVAKMNVCYKCVKNRYFSTSNKNLSKII